jgi:hypothetical protein
MALENGLGAAGKAAAAVATAAGPNGLVGAGDDTKVVSGWTPDVRKKIMLFPEYQGIRFEFQVSAKGLQSAKQGGEGCNI